MKKLLTPLLFLCLLAFLSGCRKRKKNHRHHKKSTAAVACNTQTQ